MYNTKQYISLILSLFNVLNKEVCAKLALMDIDDTAPFLFSDYPATQYMMQYTQQQFVTSLHSIIMAGTSDAWYQSNLLQDLIADKYFAKFKAQINGVKKDTYYQVNSDHLKAFQSRVTNGMNLSQRIWNLSNSYKQGLEAALSVAIERGTSAVTLSKQVSKYLNNYPQLRATYAAKYGKAVNIRDCQYESARLARTEINMAYRTAENVRWQQMDFIVGYEIKTSGSHPEHDICDTLKGKYPKDFVWVGWHPQCLCYKIPIMKTEEEFFSLDNTPSKNEVKKVPANFIQWVTDNEERIAKWEQRKTTPYFIKDNKTTIKDILTQKIKITPKVNDNPFGIVSVPNNNTEVQTGHFIGTELDANAIINLANLPIDSETAQRYYEAVKGFSYQWDYEIRQIQTVKNVTSKHGHTTEEIVKRAQNLERFISDSPKWQGYTGDLSKITIADLNSLSSREIEATYKGLTFRGMNITQDVLDKIMSDLNKGECDMLGSASWSTYKRVAVGFTNRRTDKRVVFIAKGHEKATSIKYLSEFPAEQEVVASMDCRYKLIKSETFDDILYLFVEPA